MKYQHDFNEVQTNVVDHEIAGGQHQTHCQTPINVDNNMIQKYNSTLGDICLAPSARQLIHALRLTMPTEPVEHETVRYAQLKT